MLVHSPDVGVVVVAYRSAETIQSCLEGLLRDPRVIVVVVDNSTDSATERIASSYGPRVEYVASENLGFGASCNRGAALLRDRIAYLAFINPDLSLSRDLGSLVELSKKHPCALVGGETGTESSSARPFATPLRELGKAVVGPRAYSIPLSGGHPRPVEQLSGALLLCSREFFTTLGGFDERFELYYEDVDLCRRAHLFEGCWLDPQYYGEHIGNASYSQASRIAYRAHRISRIRYLRKHHPKFGASFLFTLGILEYLARGVARTPEGWSTRSMSVADQLQEILAPGETQILRG